MAANGVNGSLTAPEPLPQAPEELPPLGCYANQFLRNQTAAIQNAIPLLPNATRNFIKALPDTLNDENDTLGGNFHVGIVGAGCAGLFTAMIFNYLNKVVDNLNISYDILEANKEDRIGGRLYSYKFPDKDGYVSEERDYYDVGGMRFPDNPVMTKTFQLFELLGMTSQYRKNESSDKQNEDEWAEWKKQWDTTWNDSKAREDLLKKPVPKTLPFAWKTWKKRYDAAWNDSDLQSVLKFNKPSMKTESGEYVQKGQLIPYYMAGKNCPMIFNGVQAVQPETKDFMSAKDFQIDNLPGRVLTADPSAMIDDFMEEYRIVFHRDGPKAFWDLLQRKGDAYSTRQYLTNWGRYDYNTIEFLEVMNSGNGWFDQSFSEWVVDSMEFDYGLSGENVFWWCVYGGAQQLPKTMQDPSAVQDKSSSPAHSSLKKLDVQTGKKVTEIWYDWPSQAKDWWLPKVRLNYKDVTNNTIQESAAYDAVFNSTTLGCQQHMKLEGLNLNWGTKQAIRSLAYGASSKIGIRFKTLWWISPKITIQVDGQPMDVTTNINKGGLGRTDESIGCCVYPSYNIEDDLSKPGVLLASYNWAQSAQRLSALIDRKSPENEEDLKQLLIHDLAKLHAPQYPKDPKKTKKVYDGVCQFIAGQWLDHYAWDWYHDEYSAGAFAFFGPGQFQNMWPYVIRNNGTYLVIGEAASSHHAWVVGALESAVRAVYQFLWVRSMQSKACSEAAKLFVQDTDTQNKIDPFRSLFCGLPVDFNRTDDIKTASSGVASSPIGEFLRQGVFVEVCRLIQDQDLLNPTNVTQDLVDDFYKNKTW